MTQAGEGTGCSLRRDVGTGKEADDKASMFWEGEKGRGCGRKEGEGVEGGVS